MKSLKKTLVLLVVLSMILSAVSPVFAFNDVIDEVYAEQANKMAAFGVFTGDANGNFNAEENITRAEMAVVIGRLMGLTTNEANANQNYASNFSDVAAGEWYTGWVNLVSGRGIISGFPDGTFRPNEKVTQAQAVTMIVKALGWGVVVDQAGTWPANYITKAAELRIFKDAVSTNNELVTRGNVAIYCYNALTAKTWDVAESTGNELTSKKSNDTILAKYFSDFVNEDGEMKLVEEAYVSLSGANTTTIGQNQVEIVSTGIVADIDAEKAPKRDEELATYKVDANTVVAYVPAEVASVANLAGRKVDVIFGADNVVAYIAVTDDSYENVFVTAFDGEEIEIDGEEYEINSSVSVNVFGHNVGTGVAAITKVLETELNAVNSKDELTRSVIAEFIVNGDDEIETINFKFSVNGYTSTADSKLTVNEFIVEKISAKNVLTVEGTSAKNDIDDYEDAKPEPRVIKNGEIATVADIEVGDVVTEVVYDSTVEVMIVVSNTVAGEVTDYLAKTNTLEVDGTEYKAIAKPFYNEEGETDDYTEGTSANQVYNLFEDEEVTVYLNMAGEVVAVIGETEATGMVLGVVTKDASDEEDEDDVEYAKLRILAEDGTEKQYKVYNKKAGKDLASDDAARSLKAGDMVVFSADADRVIKSDDIEKVVTDGSKTYDFKSNTDVEVAELTTFDAEDKKLNGNRFSSATIVLNPTEEEVISSWEVLVDDKDTTTKTDDTFTTVETGTKVYVFSKGSKVVYVVACIDEDNYGASDDQYGIVLDTRKDKDEDDETVYFATILVDGKEVEFECDADFRSDIEEGSFIVFDVADSEIDTYTVLATKEMVDYVADLAGDAMVVNDYKAFTTLTTATSLKAITVDSVETVDGDSYVVLEDEATTDLADGYIVYSLEDSEEIDEIAEGAYVLFVDADTNEDGMEIVIVL